MSTYTELEAVNTMLAIIGEQPVNTLEDSGVSEATLARTTLLRVSREVQAKGLNCNSEDGVSYTPDNEGFINLPAETLMVDASDPTRKVAQRGLRLYDLEEHSYVFSEPIDLDIVLMLAFDDLPQTVKDYVVIKAARKFAANVLGSDIVHQLSAEDEMSAYRVMAAAELDKGDFTIFDAPDCIQAVLNRAVNATRK